MKNTPAAGPEVRYVESRDGLRLAAHDCGGSGETLLLCHCTGALARIWDPVTVLLRQDFRVIAPDTRGHGDSEAPEGREGCSWVRMGQDLIDIIDALNLPLPIKACGHSAGATQIVMAEWLQPGTFSRVVLMDAIIGPADFFEGENRLAAKARRRKSLFDSRETARQRFRDKPPMNAWEAAVLDAYVQWGLEETASGRWRLKCDPEVEAHIYEMGHEQDLFDHLHESGLEALIVTGETSDIAPLAEAQHQRFRRSEWQVMPGRSHFMPQEDPAAVADLIRSWLPRRRR
jgi:pimeloyl-ACP methyl ester carboxylesterase